MNESSFLYIFGILMAVMGWLGGRSVKKTEELDRLMNSGLEEWEIVKLRIAMQKVDPYKVKMPGLKQPSTNTDEAAGPTLKELLNFRIKRK